MRLSFEESDAVISLTIEHGGQAVRNETVLDRKKVRGPDMAKGFIIEWSKLHVRPVFAAMPVESFQVVYPEGAGEILVSAAMTVGEVLANTNSVLAKIATLAGAAKGKPRTLYVNPSDDLRYASLYEKIRDENWLYLNHQLGYDRKTRTWGKTEPPLGVDELVQYIVENRVGRLVAVNTYLVENYFSVDRVWLPAILERLGVEHVTIDNDPHDLRPWGFLMRKLVSSEAPRFSNLSILNEWSDSGGRLPVYGAIPQDYTGGARGELGDDYSIVVLSNSRMNLVSELRPQIDFFTREFPQPNIFRDFQAWYLATRRMVLESDLPLSEKLLKNHLLHMVFYGFLQEMKFWVIRAMKTDRKVDVYGDVGWKEVCPDYYRGSLDNREIETLFAQGNQLFLLVNLSFNYLDASGPVYDMQRRQVPWLNMVPMVASDTFAPLRMLEYDNDMDELNWKLDNAHTLWAKEPVRKALEEYRGILASSTQNIRTVLDGNPQNGRFAAHLAEHKALVDGVVKAYAEREKEFIEATYKSLLGW